MAEGGGKKWIAGATKNKGALRAELGVQLGQTIPKAKLAKASQAGGKLAKQANLAETLAGFRRK